MAFSFILTPISALPEDFPFPKYDIYTLEDTGDRYIPLKTLEYFVKPRYSMEWWEGQKAKYGLEDGRDYVKYVIGGIMVSLYAAFRITAERKEVMDYLAHCEARFYLEMLILDERRKEKE